MMRLSPQAVRQSVLLGFLLVTAICSAQSTPLESSIGANVYTNFFFRFRYEFTSSWVPQPVSMDREMEKRDREGKAGAAKTPNSYVLLNLTRTLPDQGPNGRSHAVISFTAEEVPAHSEIVDGQAALLKFTDNLKKQRYITAGKLQVLKIGGRSFFRQDMKGKSEGADVYQSGVFTVLNGYSVGFLLTSPTQSLLNNMTATLNKIQFF
jgi:hypothetical protein